MRREAAATAERNLADSRPYQGNKSRAPFLGIPADVGLPEICG